MKKFLCYLLSLTMILSIPMQVMAVDIDTDEYASASAQMAIAPADYTVDFEITYSWEDCYAAVISVNNACAKSIDNWELTFDLDSDIITIENAQIADVIGDKFFLSPKSYSDVIPAGGTIQIGLLISGTTEALPNQFSLTGTYQDGTFVDVTVIGKQLYQGEDDFYVVNDSTNTLSGTFVDVDNISECVYTIEDEYGNILANGNVEIDGTWTIENIGFGIGYNHVSFIGKSGSNPVYSSFDVVNFDLDNTKQLGVNLELDSDNDGICNYLEEVIGIDPYDENSISEDKTDLESIMGTLESGLGGSSQADDEGVVDAEPSNDAGNVNVPITPSATNITSMVIHRTSYPEGSKTRTSSSPKYVADDLTFNDYTYTELCSEGSVFAVANVTPEALMWGEMSAIFTVAKRPGSSMNSVLDDLVDTFHNGNSNNEGTTVEVGDRYSSSKYVKFSDSDLTSAVRNDDATDTYLDLIKNYVVDFLRDGGDPYDLRYVIGGDDNLIEDYVYTFDTTPYPSYGGATALGIAIHGWHGHTITLQNYNETSTRFSGTLKFHFYDHFGLDQDDEITHVGFCDWFTLQHYDRFDGSYVPFLTYCDISIPISGTFK